MNGAQPLAYRSSAHAHGVHIRQREIVGVRPLGMVKSRCHYARAIASGMVCARPNGCGRRGVRAAAAMVIRSAMRPRAVCAGGMPDTNPKRPTACTGHA